MKLSLSILLTLLFLPSLSSAETEITIGTSGLGSYLVNWTHFNDYDSSPKTHSRGGWGLTFAKKEYQIDDTHVKTKGSWWVGTHYTQQFEFVLPSNDTLCIGPVFGFEAKTIDSPNSLQWQWGINGRWKMLSFNVTNEQVAVGVNFLMWGTKTYCPKPFFANRSIPTTNETPKDTIPQVQPVQPDSSSTTNTPPLNANEYRRNKFGGL